MGCTGRNPENTAGRRLEKVSHISTVLVRRACQAPYRVFNADAAREDGEKKLRRRDRRPTCRTPAPIWPRRRKLLVAPALLPPIIDSTQKPAHLQVQSTATIDNACQGQQPFVTSNDSNNLAHFVRFSLYNYYHLL